MGADRTGELVAESVAAEPAAVAGGCCEDVVGLRADPTVAGIGFVCCTTGEEIGTEGVDVTVSFGADMMGDAWQDAVADLTPLVVGTVVVVTETDGLETVVHETNGVNAVEGDWNCDLETAALVAALAAAADVALSVAVADAAVAAAPS